MPTLDQLAPGQRAEVLALSGDPGLVLNDDGSGDEVKGRLGVVV